MKIENLAQYEVGDKVLITKEWNGGTQNHDGEMDHWLGKIMTIRDQINENVYLMEEDKGENPYSLEGSSGWIWNRLDIEGKISE